MAEARYAIVKDGKVVNVVVWDANTDPEYVPHEGELVACNDEVGIGDSWDGVKFTPQAP